MSARRLQYLAEIGIPVYTPRRAAGRGRGGGRGVAAADPAPAAADWAPAAADADAGGRAAADAAPVVVDAAPVAVDAAPAAADAAPAAADAAPAAADAAPAAVYPHTSVRDDGAADAAAVLHDASVGDDWSVLEAQVRACRGCALHQGRTQTVFGVGRRDAALLVVGEAPGEEEDRRGEPFVGRAGQLLNAMLGAIGHPRGQVYIANVVKCRPPGNRNPRPEEAGACAGYLDRQIALIRPRAILAVGKISAQRLLRSERPVGQLRGVVHRYGETGIPLVVTYHPAYLLRSPIEKAKSWQDLCMLRPLLASSQALSHG